MSNSSFVRMAAAIGVLALSFALAGCGRKGPLDPPPRAQAQPADPQAAAGAQPGDPAARQAQGTWPLGQPATEEEPAPRGQKKSFALDWLLN